MKKPKRHITARIDADLYKVLAILAKRKRRSLSDVINQLCILGWTTYRTAVKETEMESI